MVKGLAPRLNVMESIVTLAESVGDVFVEVLKVAVSPGLTAAIPPDQFVPVFQSAEAGALSQVASVLGGMTVALMSRLELPIVVVSPPLFGVSSRI